MSGAQGARPMGSPTRTTYESVEGGKNKTALDLRSTEDEGGIQIEEEKDKAGPDAALPTGHVFGQTEEEENKKDLGVTGTG